MSICTSLLTAPKPLLIDLNPHNKYRIYKPPLIFYTRCTQVYIQQSSPEKRSEDQLCGSDAGNTTILEIVVNWPFIIVFGSIPSVGLPSTSSQFCQANYISSLSNEHYIITMTMRTSAEIPSPSHYLIQL